MNNLQSQFDKLILLCSNNRLHRFNYHNKKEIGIKLGDRADIVLVYLDNKVMLLSRAFLKWDAIDSQSILDFEIDTMPTDSNMLQWIANRWDY